VVFGLVARFVGVSLWRLLVYIRDEILVVAATTSTETVLPRVMQKMRDAGCKESVVGFVVPAGYSFNLDGTCLYLVTVAVFLAQATNTHLTFWHELGLIAVLLLTSKGAAGVAGAAFVVLAATLSTTGTIPVASIALILGIHRILAEGLTFVNLVGNSLAAVVVARWEGAIDDERLAATIGTAALRRRAPPRPPGRPPRPLGPHDPPRGRWSQDLLRTKTGAHEGAGVERLCHVAYPLCCVRVPAGRHLGTQSRADDPGPRLCLG
jgi:aerobic C4-dicarboxylate transport protein